MNALPALVAHSDTEPTCDLHWIGKQLGWDFEKRSSKKLEIFVSGLIASYDFPKPMPHQMHGGGISEDVNYPRSRWVKVGVLIWLVGYTPSDTPLTLDELAANTAADEMDSAALHLHLVGGTEVD